MGLERIIKLPDKQIISDRHLNNLLDSREKKLRQKRKTSPAMVFAGIDMYRLQISRKPMDPIGRLEVRREGKLTDSEPLFEISDVSIDLTPESPSGIRGVMKYEINVNGKEISVEALFDETSRPEFKELNDPNNPEKIEPLIREELLDVIQEKKWKRGIFNGSWSVAKKR